MAFIGEAALSASIEVLFTKLSSTLLLKFAYREQVRTELKKWEKTLLSINAVLRDAEEKQISNHSVGIWLGELRDLAYDVDDILDDFATEAFRSKLMGERKRHAGSSKVCRYVPGCFAGLNPNTAKFNATMMSKINKITLRLQDIVARKNDLGLKENYHGGKSDRPLPTTSLVNEALVYGRERDKELILELLLTGEASGHAELSVIPVLGMGGVGKTTLAQLLYNDEKVDGCFDIKAWVCVSQDFDVARVTKTILQSVASEMSDVDDLNLLQIKLKEKLSRKKFLIVLDDVWNENYDQWTVLRSPLEAGLPGSKVLVTTRNQGVSSVMGTAPAYLLKDLSNDACLSVFTQHALGARDFSAHQDLREIGEKILKRCKGLPLAAKTLGGLLRTKLVLDEWEYVLNSKLWDISEERSGIIPVLRLSYYHLPSHLKRCFAYCSVLPKDFEFQERDLVLLWMAEGLIPQSEGNKKMEDVGCSYFRELLSRSFFQPSSRDKSWFVMHELISDLAQWVSGEICFRLDDKLDGNEQQKQSKRIRHASYIRGIYDGISKFEALFEVKSLRSFLPLKPPEHGVSHLTYNVPNYLLPKLQCLRALSFSGYHITELPISIGNLKHLRYLDLSHTQIKSLPESLGTLYNLQTLILEGCSHLKKLPNIGNLINLRHLNNFGANSLKGMPLQIGKLSSLQTLPKFVVGKTGARIRELGPLVRLRATLHVSELQNVVEARDAREANLIDKEDLEVLLLEWGSRFYTSQNENIETDVLDMLQPHKNLKELSVMQYGGEKLPIWLGDQAFSKMAAVRLKDCEKCTCLPSLGQLPSLKDVSVSGMTGVKSIGTEFYGKGCSQPFPALETLCFEDMQAWSEWIDYGNNSDAFPCLRELFVQNCPKLRGTLPNNLPLLEKLVIDECEQLVVSISSLTALSRLNIQGCKELMCSSLTRLSSLKSVALSEISELASIKEVLMQGLTEVKELTLVGCKDLKSLWQNEVQLLQHLSSLEHLVIESCPQLVSLVEEEDGKKELQHLQHACSIQHLELKDCETLEKLPKALHSLTSLRKLNIEDCPRLVSFLEAHWPSMVTGVRIKNSNALVSLPEAMAHNSTCLERLYIDGCDSLVTIARSQLPHTLKRLEISNCKNLKSLLETEQSSFPESGPASCLEHLSLKNCSSLNSLSSRGALPPVLKYLEIENCSELESLAESLHGNTSLESLMIWEYCDNLKSLPDNLHELRHLHWIAIAGCPIVSFPEEGLPSSLRVLRIEGCNKLESLPNCIHSLTFLQQLTISDCPAIASFPEEGLPTNLTSLWIKDLKVTKHLLRWGLHRLTCLSKLSIWGCPDLAMFPQDDGKDAMMLPSSLTSLSILDLPNLESLSSNGFERLSSLEYLSIYDCPKLVYLPRQGLPPSLARLDIQWCPLLKYRCKRGKGQYWPMIAHIPCIYVDDTFIYDTKEK